MRRMVVGATAVMAHHGSGPALAAIQSYAQIMGLIQAHSATLAFVNAFWVVTIVVACLIPLPFLLKRAPSGSTGTVSALLETSVTNTTRVTAPRAGWR